MSFQERMAIIIEANAGKAIAEFKKVGAAAKQAGDAGQAGAKGLARFGIAGQTASNLLKGGIAAAAAGAGAAIAKFAVAGVDAFVEVTGEIRKFQRVSGATAEDASKLVSAFHVLGIDADAAGNAVWKLSVNIGTSKKALAESGIEIAKARNGNVDLVETILNVGDAYKATGDVTKKANVLVAAFGAKQGQALMPLLGKTREEIEAIFAAAGRHGLIFSQEQLDRAKEFAVATRELGEAWKGVQVAAGEKIVPFLTDLAIALTKVTDAGHEAGSEGKGGKALKDLANNLVVFSVGIGPPVALATKALHWFAGGEGEAARAAAAATVALGEQEAAFDATKKSIFAATDAQRSYEAAGRSVEAAHRTFNKALTDYNKLLKEGAVDEEKVADARESLAAATRGLGHAQREQSKVQDEYNDALAAANILGTDTSKDKLSDAAGNLADANDSVTTALEAQAKAAADLAKAKAGDPDYQQKLADAKQNVADGTQGIADAEYNLGKQSYLNIAAHDAEAAAIAGKADQVARLRTELDLMLKLNPEQFAFLGPILGGLPAGPPAAFGPPAPNPAVFGPPAPTSSGGIVQKVGDTIINIAQAVPDPVEIAHKIMWNLTG